MSSIILSSIDSSELVDLFRNTLKEELSSLSIGENNVEDTKLLTRKEAAKLLGVSLTTLTDWVKEGIVPAYRIGTRVRFKENEILDSLEQIRSYKHFRKGGVL